MFDFIHLFINDFSIKDYIIFLLGIIVTIAGVSLKLVKKIGKKQKYIIKKHFKTQSNIDANIDKIKKQTNNLKLGIYKVFIKKILGYLKNLLGDLKPLSLKAFDRHFIYSFIYSFLFFYVAWLFGASGQMGIYELLPNENKLSITLYLCFASLIFYIFYSSLGETDDFASKMKLHIPYFGNNLLSYIGLAIMIMLGVGAGVEIAIVVIVGLLTVMIVRTRRVGAGIVLLILAGIMAIVIIIKIEVIFGVVGVGGGKGENLRTTNVIYLLFIIILPLLNSVFDYMSMYASRFFAQNILETNSKIKIIRDAILDFFVAICLLILLAMTLYFIIDMVNIHLIQDSTQYIPIEYYKNKLMSDSLHKDVLWITLMFISTLIPTILHILLAMYTVILYIIIKPHLNDLIAKLEGISPSQFTQLEIESIAKQLSINELSNYIKVVVVAIMFMVLLIFLVVYMILVQKSVLSTL